MRNRSAPLTVADLDDLDWAKMDGLLPAIAQDVATGYVLMLGYVTREALAATLTEGFATFFSRSREQLWRKGDTSGNRLALTAAHTDCDGDAVLLSVVPEGPTCHLGTRSCFATEPAGAGWLAELERIIASRAGESPKESYTATLLAAGMSRVAQKVGEEGLELALAAVGGSRENCIEEAADLAYHVGVLMHARGFTWGDVVATLVGRSRDKRLTTSRITAIEEE